MSRWANYTKLISLLNNLTFFLIHSNAHFSEIYPEKIGATAKEFEAKKLEILSVAYEDLARMRGTEYKSKCLEYFEKIVGDGYLVFNTLAKFFGSNYFPNSEIFKPTSWETFETFEKLMSKLKHSADDQIFALRLQSVDDVLYDRPIILPKELILLEEDPDRFGLNKKIMLIYDQILPFHNKNHDDRNCISSKDLPLFYRRK